MEGTVSPVGALTSGGPIRRIVPPPLTMTASFDILGTYVPPTMHDRSTTLICGIARALRPKWSRLGSAQQHLEALDPP